MIYYTLFVTQNCWEITYCKLIVNHLYHITFPKVGKHVPYPVMEHCPPGYCQPNTNINITQHDILCKGNRMGWLCGHCKVNYSVVLGSNVCYKFSNTLYIALTLRFGILGGFVYVLVLFGLRLTIDLGILGGFIFWLNIMWLYVISSNMTFNNRGLKYMVYLLTFIKYQLNIPVCLTSNFNELGNTAVFYFIYGL